jgi:hypothetical protein
MMKPADRHDNLYVGKKLPPGYRLEILPKGKRSKGGHHAGGQLAGPVKDVPCPNCNRPLFPVFRLNLADDRVARLRLWDLPFLNVLVCPCCALSMEAYWTRFGPEIEVMGGERDGGQLLNPDIDVPYETRAMRLVALKSDDYPLTEETIAAHGRRIRAPGVYHQLGGLPFRYSAAWDWPPVMNCCACDKSMTFAGVVDYDTLNVPLYERGGHPVALIIGDNDCLYWFTCRKCHTIGFQWIY